MGTSVWENFYRGGTGRVVIDVGCHRTGGERHWLVVIGSCVLRFSCYDLLLYRVYITIHLTIQHSGRITSKIQNQFVTRTLYELLDIVVKQSISFLTIYRIDEITNFYSFFIGLAVRINLGHLDGFIKITASLESKSPG